MSSTVFAAPVLEQLAGPKPVPLDGRLWQSVLAFTTPASRFDPAEVEAAIRPHLAALVYNNSATLNLQRLLHVVARQLRKCEAHGGSVGDANAVFLVRAILKDLTEQLNPVQLLGFVELPPPGPGGGSGSSAAAAAATAAAATAAAPDVAAELGEDKSLVAELARAALRVLGSKPALSAGNYLVQLEVVQLLLVLCSTQLFTPSARAFLGGHPFIEAIMQQRDLANPVVEALLGYYTRAPAVPLSLKLFIPTDTRTVLRIVRSAAASVLRLPYQAYTLLIRPRAHSPHAPDSPLGDAALLLLLVLVFHAPPQDAPYGNPYRQSLQRLQDADDLDTDPEGGRTGSASGDAAVPYGVLFDALGRTLSSERAVLLLYALLHGSPHFREYCLVRSDLETLLLPLLELLYSAHQRTANQMYMLLIILLMLSQDASFAQNVHRITLQSVPFYRERSMMRTSLGSLLVVLLLRTAHYNLAKLRDVYLHTNTLAALANLAPHMSGLSSHAAQRLVSLFHLLARRYQRLQAAAERGQGGAAAAVERAGHTTTEGEASLQDAFPSEPTQQQQQRQAAAQAAEPVPGSSSSQQQQQQQPPPQQQQPQQQPEEGEQQGPGGEDSGGGGGLELQLYADFLRIVLEIVNAILTNALPQNPELVYTLLHRQEVFAPFRDHPRYAELMDNVQAVTDYFNRKVEEAARGAPAGDLSAEGVLAVIRQHSRGWRRDRLRPFPELRFTYEEEANPEEFFLPYVWSLVVAHAGIPWHLEAIVLFTPSLLPAGSLTEQETGQLSPRTTAALASASQALGSLELATPLTGTPYTPNEV